MTQDLERDTKPPYRDGATLTAAIALIRMGCDNKYRDVAIARFGHIPSILELKEALDGVRRDGVRRDEA